MTSASSKKIGVVLPAHNEAQTITVLLDDLISSLRAEFSESSLRIVVVDDGSTDTTRQVVTEYKNSDAQTVVELISFTRNFGKESAMYAGLHHLVDQVDRVCVMDADGQHPPIELVRMLEESFRTGSCVAGYQDYSSNSISYRLGARLLRLLQDPSSEKNPKGLSDFRVLTNSAVRSFLDLPERSRFSRELFDYLGIPTIFTKYRVAERADGTTSRWTRRSLVSYATTAITSRGLSILPSLMFVSLSVIGVVVLYAIVVSVKSIIDGNLTGTASILFALVMFQVVQFVFLFFISAIVANLMIEAKRRPMYKTREE